MVSPAISVTKAPGEAAGTGPDQQGLTGPLKALILDDSSFDRRRLMRECRDAGFDIAFAEAPTLSELKAALDAQTFDLVFVDFRLTDGDGLGALERIYSHPDHIGCATIMIAGEAETDIAVKAITAGCSDYLVKSRIDAESIRRAVSNAIHKAAMQREITTANGMNAAMLKMIDRFASECLTDMKPILSRMLRKIRHERGLVASEDGHAVRDEVEASCNELWAFLQRIEDYAARLRREQDLRETAPN